MGEVGPDMGLGLEKGPKRPNNFFMSLVEDLAGV